MDRCTRTGTDTATTVVVHVVVAVLMVTSPHVLVDGTRVATGRSMEPQFASRRHGRFQTTRPLIGLGVVCRLAEIL